MISHETGHRHRPARNHGRKATQRFQEVRVRRSGHQKRVSDPDRNCETLRHPGRRIFREQKPAHFDGNIRGRDPWEADPSGLLQPAGCQISGTVPETHREGQAALAGLFSIEAGVALFVHTTGVQILGARYLFVDNYSLESNASIYCKSHVLDVCVCSLQKQL